MSNLITPRNPGVKQPDTTNRENGNIHNPNTYQKFGGFSGPSKGGKALFTVKKPSDGKKVY
jgi:hypothetical protein